ncbi:MAG: lysophospholipase [Verrucomicrobiales bacterium]|nr:lysophospholipase [Verrucomicrobiales bacterium]
MLTSRFALSLRAVMQQATDHYHSESGGGKLFRRVFTPRDLAPEAWRGGVLLVHGLGDHLACHEKAARMFCDQGLVAAGVDWPGHGQSFGKRGSSRQVDSLLDLIGESLADLRARLPAGSPVGLYAHSAGGFVLLQFLRQQLGLGQQGVNYPAAFSFVWLSSPLLQPTHGQGFLKIKIGKFLSKIAPGLRLDTGVRSGSCYPPDPVTGIYKEDELKHHKISLAFGADLMRRSLQVQECAGAFREPTRLLITQGDADQVCPAQFSRDFFEAVSLPSCNKTYRLLPGVLHEPLNDPGADDLLTEVGEWLGAALNEASGKACKNR